MNKYRLFYLFWLIPGYLLFLIVQQGLVYQGSTDTYENGTSYLADVIDFDVKQIAAQTNGYVVIRFETPEETIARKMTLSVQMAQQIMESQVIPVRYQKDAYQEIVLMPTYSLQKQTALSNLSIALIGFVVTAVFAFFVHRFANKRIRGGDEELIIERVDE